MAARALPATSAVPAVDATWFQQVDQRIFSIRQWNRYRARCVVRNMRAMRCALMAVAVITLITAGCAAQSTDHPAAAAEYRQVVTGTLWRVGGPAPGTPVPLAGQVVARNEAGEQFTAVTTGNGRFQLLLPPGTYQLTSTSPQVSSGRAVGRLSGPAGAVLHVTSKPIHDVQIVFSIRL